MLAPGLFQNEADNDNRIQRITRTLDYVGDSLTELRVKDASTGTVATLPKSAIDWAWAKGGRVEVTLPQSLAREQGIA